MNVRKIDEIKDMLCIELEKFSAEKEFSMTEIERIHKLSESIRSLEKIKNHHSHEKTKYSGNGEWTAHGTYGENRRSSDDEISVMLDKMYEIADTQSPEIRKKLKRMLDGIKI